jgi:hypothetical protein
MLFPEKSKKDFCSKTQHDSKSVVREKRNKDSWQEFLYYLYDL